VKQISEPETKPIDAVVLLARALDADDFVTVRSLLDPDVSYRIGTELHRGPDTVVQSHWEGSGMARQLFDRVEFDHTVVGLIGDRTVRVDFSDRLEVAGDVFEHHSVQEIVVGDRSAIVSIVDQTVAGQRERLDSFMKDHRLVRPPAPG
jgi:hypothetical protein